MSDKKFIIANWKNTKTVSDCVDWIRQVGPQLSEYTDHIVIVCPPFVALPDVARIIRDQEYVFRVGAQSVSRFPLGAYTGEVGAFAVKDYVSYALLGHSERRSHLHETNEDIAQQTLHCREHGIEPIILVRDSHDVIPDDVSIFAWEPVSAIGTGQAIASQDAGATIATFSTRSGMRGIYGGSVTPSNISSFMTHDSIEGVLIGSASNEAARFMEMIHALR